MTVAGIRQNHTAPHLIQPFLHILLLHSPNAPPCCTRVLAQACGTEGNTQQYNQQLMLVNNILRLIGCDEPWGCYSSPMLLDVDDATGLPRSLDSLNAQV